VRWLRSSSLGFTLTEVIIGMGILTVVTGTAGVATMQTLESRTMEREDSLAAFELRKGLSWVAEDASMAATSDLLDGGPSASSVVINWIDKFQDAGTAHTASYVVVNGSLIRSYDGVAHPVARRIVSASFSRSGKTVTAQLEVRVNSQTTRQLTVKTIMRAASP